MGTKFGGDIRVTLETGREFEIPAPPDPADNYIDFVNENGNILTARAQVTPRKSQDYTEELKTYSKRKMELQKDMEKSYSIVFGQCTYELQQKLENKPEWPTIRDTQSVLDLLELIKVTTFKLEDEKYLPLSIHNAKSVYYRFDQGSLYLIDCREKFMNVVGLLLHMGINYMMKLCQNKSVQRVVVMMI